MKVTYEQLILSARYFDELTSLRLPMAQLLRLRQALRIISEHLKTFDEVRQEILARYNLENEDDKKKAEAEFQEALRQTVELTDYKPITIRCIPEDQVFSLGFLEGTEWMWELEGSE